MIFMREEEWIYLRYLFFSPRTERNRRSLIAKLLAHRKLCFPLSCSSYKLQRLWRL